MVPGYSQKGVDEFLAFANATAIRAGRGEGELVLVAIDQDGLVGMLEFMPPNRIALLFVALRHCERAVKSRDRSSAQSAIFCGKTDCAFVALWGAHLPEVGFLSNWENGDGPRHHLRADGA